MSHVDQGKSDYVSNHRVPLRVSSDDQSADNQRRAIEARYSVARCFVEEGVSGAVPASQRPAMASLLVLRTVVVGAIDRLGRNTIDVLTTVEALKAKGVSVVFMREGFDLATPAGEFTLTILAAVAKLERETLKVRQMAVIERAKAEGKNLGRQKIINDEAVVQWRQENAASIKETAEHFGISTASVKRAYQAAKVVALSESCS